MHTPPVEGRQRGGGVKRAGGEGESRRPVGRGSQEGRWGGGVKKAGGEGESRSDAQCGGRDADSIVRCRKGRNEVNGGRKRGHMQCRGGAGVAQRWPYERCRGECTPESPPSLPPSLPPSWGNDPTCPPPSHLKREADIVQRHGQTQAALLGGIFGQDGFLELVAPLRFEVKLLIFIALLSLMIDDRESGRDQHTLMIGREGSAHCRLISELMYDRAICSPPPECTHEWPRGMNPGPPPQTGEDTREKILPFPLTQLN